MRTVKLTIEVEVPDQPCSAILMDPTKEEVSAGKHRELVPCNTEEINFITIDEGGRVSSFSDDPSPSERHGVWYSKNILTETGVHIKNWRDLKINLREYFTAKNSASSSSSSGDE